MYEHVEKTIELALIRGLGAILLTNEGVQKGGRLKNKCEKLVEISDKELSKLPRINYQESIFFKKSIAEFGKITGWAGKEKHVTTYLSFLMALIDGSDFKYDYRISELISVIFNFFERKKDQKFICFVAGDIAYEKWKKIIKKGDF